MKKLLFIPLLFTLFINFSTAAVVTVDTKNSSNNAAGEFFGPVGGHTASPFYRFDDMGGGPGSGDWEYIHNAIVGGTITSASLDITSYDVDFAAGEVDTVSVWDYSAVAWVEIGDLAGTNNGFNTDSFDVLGFADDIAMGLRVAINIDAAGGGWAVSLTQSDLNVTAVPEPSTWLLMGLGLAGLVALRKKKAV